MSHVVAGIELRVTLFAMNHRQIMLDVLSGDLTGRPVFAPRLDIWYHANLGRGTLPEGLAGLGLAGTAEWLGVGLHSVVPDFLSGTREEDFHHRALGFYNHQDFPYCIDFSGVDYDVTRTSTALCTTYHTGLGEVTTEIQHGDSLRALGVTIPQVMRHAVESPKDYLILRDIFSRISVHARPGNYQRYHERIGDRGLAVAFVSLACGPMQHIMRDLLPVDRFFLDMIDYPDEISGLSEELSRLYEEMLAAVMASSAEVVLFGANYDDAITYPPFFEEHLSPWLKKASDMAYSAGKLLLTHTDGENRLLMPFYSQCGVDIADSVCPAPMTRLTLADYRRAFDGKLAIWGGIPSIIMLECACSEPAFRDHVESLIEAARPFDRIVFSVADTLPPDASFDRLLYLRDRLARISL